MTFPIKFHMEFRLKFRWIFIERIKPMTSCGILFDISYGTSFTELSEWFHTQFHMKFSYEISLHDEFLPNFKGNFIGNAWPWEILYEYAFSSVVVMTWCLTCLSYIYIYIYIFHKKWNSSSVHSTHPYIIAIIWKRMHWKWSTKSISRLEYRTSTYIVKSMTKGGEKPKHVLCAPNL